MDDLVKGALYACGFAATGWSLMKFMLSVPLKVTDGSLEEKRMHLVLKVRSLNEMAFFLREVQEQSELVVCVKKDSAILHDDNPSENDGAAYLLLGTHSDGVYARLADACSLRKQNSKGKWMHFSEALAKEFEADDSGVVKFTSGEKIDLLLYQLRKLNVFLEEGETNKHFNNGDPLFQKAIDKGLITAFFPLHDTEERTHLMESWVKKKSALTPVPTMLVRDYCGNEVGFYFAFLGLYTRYLIYPTLVGLAVCIYQLFHGASNFGSTLYAVFVVAWAVGFLEAWKRRQSELAWNWGASLDDGDEMLSSEKVREEFEGELMYDEIDEGYYKVFSFTQRLKRYAITLPVLFFTILAIVIFMLVYFRAEEYVRHQVTEANGWTHGLQYVAKLPSAVYAGAVFVIDQRYCALAARLNDFENHRTEMDYTNALIAKLALFQFVNNFGLLFYITFFVGNFELLQTTLSSLLVMRLLIGNITETFIPFLMSESSVKAKVGLTVIDKDKKDAVVNRVDVEALLPVYEGTFYDYLELFIQFGQITLFASAYPLASACSLANNLIEQRSDAFKILMNHQRNPRAHHDGIGTWQHAFTILCYVAVLTNCTIIGFNSGILKALYPDITPFQTVVAVGIAEHLIIALLVFIAAIVPDVPQAVIDGVKSERAVVRKQLSIQKEFESRSRRLQRNSEISRSIDDSELIEMGQVSDMELPEGLTAVSTDKWRAWVLEEKVRRKVLEKEIQKMTNLYTLWIQTEISKSKQLQAALDEARKAKDDKKYNICCDVMSGGIVKEAATCLIRQQSGRLAQLLSISYDASIKESDAAIDAQCRANFDGPLEPYGRVISRCLKAKRLVQENKHEQAYDEHIAGFIDFLEIFRQESNWLIPMLHTLVHDARLLARQADTAISNQRGDEFHDKLKNAEQHLKRAFSLTINDRAPAEASKRPGALYIINQLFKIYFQLNTISLCRNIIKAVEKQDFSRYPKRDQVTYKYYVGRISMYEDQYHTAEEHLMFAWRHCHVEYTRNKRMILKFLVPVKLILGVMPSPKLIESYGLEEYKGIAEAIRQGDVAVFNRCLEQYQDKFIQQGVYLLMEKLKPIVMRNLFKKVYLVRNKHNHIKLVDLQNAIGYLNMSEIDMDALECLLANLIFKGYIKGYISHKLKTLVVSKKMPFPAITDVTS